MSRLLSHVALKLSASPENLATESLAFILQRSPAARRGLATYLDRTLGASGLTGLDFATQGVEADLGIPDVVGSDAGGQERMLIEAKFWAELTDNQPVTYINRLPDDGLLLFVVPSVRSDYVWRELVRRVDAAGNLGRTAAARGGTYAADLAGGKRLRLTSWRDLLGALAVALAEAGEQERLADLRQLESLCDEMDQAAFLPVHPGELTAGIWRRVGDFSGVVQDIAQNLIADGTATSAGRLTHGGTWTLYRLLANGWQVGVYFDAWALANWASTPFWLDVPSDARTHLAQYLTDPQRIWETERGTLFVALADAVGEERAGVIRVVADDCREVISNLPVLATGGTPQPTTATPAPTAAAATPAPAGAQGDGGGGDGDGGGGGDGAGG